MFSFEHIDRCASGSTDKENLTELCTGLVMTAFIDSDALYPYIYTYLGTGDESPLSTCSSSAKWCGSQTCKEKKS